MSDEGRELSFRRAAAGALIGEIAALDGGPTTADATALTPVMTYSLERGALNRLLCLHAPIAEAVLIYLCRRISATSAQVDGAPTRGLFSDLGSSESRFAKRRIS